MARSAGLICRVSWSRKNMRLTLKRLFLIVGVLALICLCLKGEYEYAQECKLEQHLCSSNAKTWVADGFFPHPRVVSVSLVGTNVDKATIQKLSTFKFLEQISIDASHVNQSTLAVLPHVSDILVYNATISDDDAQRIANLNAYRLGLYNCELSHTALLALKCSGRVYLVDN